MNAQENKPKKYKGKEYTTYEATQRQRYMEAQMRAQRQRISLLKKGGASKDEIIGAQARYRSMMAQYSDFSKQMGLSQEMERVYIDGLGRVGKKEPQALFIKGLWRRGLAIITKTIIAILFVIRVRLYVHIIIISSIHMFIFDFINLTLFFFIIKIVCYSGICI